MIVLVLAGLLAPAAGEIGCIERKLGAPAMARIGDGVVAAAERGADPGTSLDADRETLITAREACRRENDWPADTTQTAVSYTEARATRIGAERALRTDGLDPGDLSLVYAALAAPDRRGMVASITPAGRAAVNSASRSTQARRHIMLYFAALAAIEFYPVDFAGG